MHLDLILGSVVKVHEISIKQRLDQISLIKWIIWHISVRIQLRGHKTLNLLRKFNQCIIQNMVAARRMLESQFHNETHICIEV